MLLSIILGGTVTAVSIRHYDDNYIKWTSLQLFYLLVDVSGFAFCRLAIIEYQIRVLHNESVDKSLVELAAVSAPAHYTEEVKNSSALDLTNFTFGDNSNVSEKDQRKALELLRDNVRKEEQKKLELEKQKKADQRKKLLSLIVSKVSGNLLESALSFSLVSYYLIMGTVSDHPDVGRPTPFIYIAWAASLLGMFYKGCSTAIRVDGEFEIMEIPFVIIGGIVVLMPFMLFALLPAILIAQDKNGIHSILFPELISSSKFLVYFLLWGCPALIVLITILLLRANSEDDATFFFCNSMPIFTLWLSGTQISIQFQGTFRTDIGSLLCWPGTIAAFFLAPISSLAVIFMIMIDLAVLCGFRFGE